MQAPAGPADIGALDAAEAGNIESFSFFEGGASPTRVGRGGVELQACCVVLCGWFAPLAFTGLATVAALAPATARMLPWTPRSPVHTTAP